MTTSLPLLHLVPLAAGLLAAVAYDLSRRRVPNALSVFVFLSGMVVRAVDEGLLAPLAGLGAAALVVAALYGPWRAGGIGGGDVKLGAATAAWIGFHHIVTFVLASALAGGVVAGVCYALSRASARSDIRANLTLAYLRSELPPADARQAGQVSVPYALAIAAGALATFVVPGVSF